MLRASLEALAVLSAAVAFTILYLRLSFIKRKLETTMSAVTDLTAAVSNLATIAQAIEAKLSTPAGDDPAVVAAVGQINTIAAALNNAAPPAAS